MYCLLMQASQQQSINACSNQEMHSALTTLLRQGCLRAKIMRLHYSPTPLLEMWICGVELSAVQMSDTSENQASQFDTSAQTAGLIPAERVCPSD